MPSRRKPRAAATPAATPVAPPAPEPAAQELREQLDRLQKSSQEIQASIDAERKAFESKTADDRKLLEIRQEEIKDLRTQIAAARNETLLNILRVEGAIDALAPDHGRTSCSDTNRINKDRGCARCALLNASLEGYIDFTWEFQVNPPQ